jgi:GT2 family glycosyltransferase
MKRIAILCVSYNSDIERDKYIDSINAAAKNASEKVIVDIFIANNTKDNNPGYFGAIKQLMEKNDIRKYDYCIISNVDLTIEDNFFHKLAEYDCPSDIGWIAPQIWSQEEGRDRNPESVYRYSLSQIRILKLLYKYPLLDSLYTKTFYQRKKYVSKPAGQIYAGHGSFIILTSMYFEKCGIIDYPIFLYGEEIYLAEQCRNAKLKVIYNPDLKVYDYEHISTSTMKRSFNYQCRYKAIQYVLNNFY